MASEERTRAAVFTAYGVQGLCFASLVTHVPELQRRFGFSDGVLGLLLLAVPLLAGGGSVLAGALSERHGSAVVLRAAQPTVCVAVLLVGASYHLGALFPALALFGVAVGMVDASSGIQGVLLEQRYGRSIMHGFFSVWSVAGIAGALLSSLGNRLELPLPASLAVVTVVGVAASAWTGRDLLRGRPAGTQDPLADVGIPWRPLVMVGLVVTLMYVADAATSNFSAHYVQNSLHGTAAVGPLAYGAYQLAMVIGRAASDALVTRWGPVPVIRWGGVVAVLGVAGATAAPGAWTAVAAFFVLGLGLCPVAPQAFSAAGALDPQGTGVAVARINLFNYVGFLVGAPLIGLVSEAVNERFAFGLLVVAAAGVAVLARAYDPARLTSGAART